MPKLVDLTEQMDRPSTYFAFRERNNPC